MPVSLCQENKRLAKDFGDMKARLEVRESENLKLEDLLDRLQEEKKRLTQRNNKLTANGNHHMCLHISVLYSVN